MANYQSGYTGAEIDALLAVVEDNETAITALSGTNTGDETVTSIGTLINGADEKTTPVDADMVGLMDSAASNVIKKLSWANIKATIKAALGGTPALTFGTTNAAGTATTFIRTDDTILVFDATVPSTQAFGDSADAGTATTSARRDHKHAMPASPKDTTDVTGLLKGNGSVISAATAGTDYASPATITTNSDASPALGTVANNNEYRCTNTSLSTAPTLTVASIASTSTEFACAVVFKAPNTTAPVVTNNSGYTIKYSGQDVASGTWTPVANTVYRISLVFDGIYLNAYIAGVA